MNDMEKFSCNDLLFTEKSTLENPKTEDTTINPTN